MLVGLLVVCGGVWALVSAYRFGDLFVGFLVGCVVLLLVL